MHVKNYSLCRCARAFDRIVMPGRAAAHSITYNVDVYRKAAAAADGIACAETTAASPAVVRALDALQARTHALTADVARLRALLHSQSGASPPSVPSAGGSAGGWAHGSRPWSRAKGFVEGGETRGVALAAGAAGLALGAMCAAAVCRWGARRT